MDNLYQLLQCDETADYPDLKKAYSELALKFHPDKVGQHDKNSAETFSKISKAWKILSDPLLRKEYDVRWRERCLAQTFPIQDTVEFEQFEMTDDTDPEDNSEPGGSSQCDEADTAEVTEKSDDNHVSDSSCYVYSCRCGGRYLLTETDVEMKFDIVCCDSCSLTVQVLYRDNDTVS